MKDIRTTPKPIPRFGGGLRAARESLASATVPSEMIGLVAALWASVAAVSIPALLSFIPYILGLSDIWPFYLPLRESVLEKIAISFVLIPVSIVFSGIVYFFFFGPFMVIITWGIKLLKLPRGISDVLGWMFIPPLFFYVFAVTGLIETAQIQPDKSRWTDYVLPFGLLLMNGFGGLVYYLKQHQLHRETDG